MINKNKGFTLVELMVAMLIFTAMVAAGYAIMASGQSAWHLSDAQIQSQDSLRQTLDRISGELQETGTDSSAVLKATISDGTGLSGSDVLTFSIPILCEAGGSWTDANGDVANWGAPLTWGCKDSSCMDADNDCSTRDYDRISYVLGSGNQLLRRVLSTTNNILREDVIAENILNFQVVLDVGQSMMTMTVTSSKTSSNNQQVTINADLDVHLRNGG